MASRTTISGGAAMSGIYSGIDSSVLIADSLKAYQIPITRLTNQRNQIQKKQDAVNDVSSLMATLQDLARKLRDSSKLGSVAAISSDTKILTVSGTSAASLGNHTIEIDRLATSERKIHGGMASESSLVGVGQLVYSYKGVTRTILTTATTTLAGLRDLINKDASNPGISSSLLQYDSGDGKALHLVLTGKDTGSDKGIAINDAATSLNGTSGTMDFRSSSFTVVQVAQDARLRVDGYPQDPAWMTRSTNIIDDVLPGLTLTLQGAGSANVAVSRDNKQFKTDLSNLVAIYNGIMTKVQEYTGYDQENKLAGLLQGDNIVNMMISPIRSAFTARATGFTAGLDTYTTLADIGFSLDKDGRLSLDDAKISDALSRSYDAVARLLSASGIGGSSSDEIKFASAMDTTKAGDYMVKVTYDASGNAQAWVQGENNSWREMTVVGNSLTGQYGNPEQGLSLTINWDSQRGAYTTTATAHLQQGMAGGLFDTIKSLTDPANGIVKSKTDEYDSMMEAIDKSIEQKERLLENKRVVLQAKYARLEALLASLDSQKGAIDSMMKALESSNKD